MAKTYTTGLVISGDPSGGVKALKTTAREIDRLDRGMIKGRNTAQQYAQGIATGSHSLGVFSGHLKSVAGLAAGMFTASALQSQVNWADQLQKLNLRIGASTEALSQYNYVAELSGVKFTALATAWQRQTRRVAEAAVGNGEAVKALKELNLNAAELSRLRPEDQFERITAALLEVENPGKRAALAMRLWDTEGVALLQIVNQGTTAIAGMRAEADALGQTISQQTADDMATFNDEMTRVHTAIKGVAATLLADLVPGLTESLNGTNQFIGAMGGARPILENLTTVASALALVYGGRMVGALAGKTVAVIQSVAADRQAALQTARQIVQETEAIAVQARRTAGEKTAALTQAQLTQQRAASARIEAADQLRSIQLTQQQAAAERILETQRLQAQISATGRQQSLNRLAELRRSEAALAAETTAARRVLINAELTETASTRALSAAKIELARAGKIADAAIVSSVASARAATAAHSALSAVTRGLSASMALLGGPVGVAVLAAGAFLMFATSADTAAIAADDLAVSVGLATEKLRKMTDNQLLANRLKIEDALISLDRQIGITAARMETLNVNMTRTPGSKKFDQWQRELTELGGQLDTESQKAQELRDKLSEIQGYLNGERPPQLDQTGLLPPAGDGSAPDRTASLKEQARKYMIEMNRLNATERQQVSNWQADSLAQAKSYQSQGLISYKEYRFAEVAIAEEAAQRLKAIEDKRWNGYLSGGIGQLGQDYRDAQQLEGPRGEIVRSGIQQSIKDKALQGLPETQGLAPEVGGPFSEVSRLEQEREKMLLAYDQRIADYQRYRELEVENAELYDSQLAELTARRQEQDTAAQEAIQQAQLKGASETFGGLADIAKAFAGEQSGVYRAMFLAQKSFSLASVLLSSTDAIAKAWASAPFPGNLPAVATTVAETGLLKSLVSSIAMPLGQAHDGLNYVPNTGTWNLQKGERVTGAALNQDLTRFLERENRSGGRSGGSVTIEQNLTIKMDSGGDLSAQKLIEVRNMVKNTTYETIAEQMRPGGLLSA